MWGESSSNPIASPLVMKRLEVVPGLKPIDHRDDTARKTMGEASSGDVPNTDIGDNP